MYRLYILLLICFGISSPVLGQSGCTDPAATNYDSHAVVNDGSCLYPITHITVTRRADLPSELVETSGLKYISGRIWSHGDSGNPSELYAVDTTSCSLLQKIVVDNCSNIDWESITADDSNIYVGDMGNNSGDRTDLRILKIAKSDISASSTVHLNSQVIHFAYADQTNFSLGSSNNYDCEAMISLRDSLYIFTKDRGDTSTRVYKLPKTPGTYSVSPITSYHVHGLITDADYDSVTNSVILLGYMPAHNYSFLWLLYDFNSVDFFSGNKRRLEIGDVNAWHTEGLTRVNKHRMFISNESSGSVSQALWIADFEQAGLDASLLHHEQLPISFHPNPASDVLTFENISMPSTIEIYDVLGRKLKCLQMTSGQKEMDIKGMVSGVYIVSVENKEGRQVSQMVKQ